MNRTSLPDSAGARRFALRTARLWTRTRSARIDGIRTADCKQPGDANLSKVESLAQAVLDARAALPNATLADLYDADLMLPTLRRAHRILDRAVDRLYRQTPSPPNASAWSTCSRCTRRCAGRWRRGCGGRGGSGGGLSEAPSFGASGRSIGGIVASLTIVCLRLRTLFRLRGRRRRGRRLYGDRFAGRTGNAEPIWPEALAHYCRRVIRFLRHRLIFPSVRDRKPHFFFGGGSEALRAHSGGGGGGGGGGGLTALGGRTFGSFAIKLSPHLFASAGIQP